MSWALVAKVLEFKFPGELPLLPPPPPGGLIPTAFTDKLTAHMWSGKPTLLGILELDRSPASGHEDPVTVVEPDGQVSRAIVPSPVMNLNGVSMDREALGAQGLRSLGSWQWGGTTERDGRC